MKIKTYPAGHLPNNKTEADWSEPLFNPTWPEYQGHTWMRIVWTEEKLSKEDRDQLKSDGYLVYVSDQPLTPSDSPGFAHSMFFTPTDPSDEKV